MTYHTIRPWRDPLRRATPVLSAALLLACDVGLGRADAAPSPAATQPCTCDAACEPTRGGNPAPATPPTTPHNAITVRRPELPRLDAPVISLDVFASESGIHLLMGVAGDPARGARASTVRSSTATAPAAPSTRRSREGTMRLFHSFSANGGLTWSVPTRVDAGAPAPMMQHRGDDARIAQVGRNLVAVWTTPGSGAMGSGPLGSALSTDDGRTWRPGPDPSLGNRPAASASPSPTAPLLQHGASAATAPASRPVDKHGRRFVALAAHGDLLHLVWLDALDKARSVRAVRSADGGASWSAERVIDPEICACCWNTLRAAPATDGGAVGDLFVTYRDINPSDMGVARSRDGGRTWRSLGHVGSFDWRFDGCPHVGAGLALAPIRDEPVLGGLAQPLRVFVSLWTGEARHTGAYIVISDDGGTSWRPPTLIGSAQRARHTDIAALDARRAAVVWDEIELSDKAVYASLTRDGGRSWSPPMALSIDDAQAGHPRIVVVGGRYLALWTQASDSPTAVEASVAGAWLEP